jgi:hypothetical protein
MASKPLDTYIKTPPPSNPASRETYLEQQLGSIEKVLQRHTNTIEENYENNVASITEEQGVRATADSALAYSLQQLSATVEVNNASTQGQITNLQTAAADASTATATQLQTLTAKVDTNLGSTNAAISNEQKARATADSSLASKISTLTAQAEFSDSKLQASITSETSARVTAISAEATSRQALQSFVGWNGGSYSSNLVETMETRVSKTDGASYAWAVQGTIDGATGGLRLTGAKRLNPTTNAVETTTNLIIDANTRINGDLLVTGTVAAARLATIPGSKLASSGSGTGDLVDTNNLLNRAVSNSAGGSAASTTANISISLKAGDRVSIIASSAASGSSGGAFSGNLQVDGDYGTGAFLVSSVGITSFLESVALGYNGVAYFLVSSFKLPNATLLAFYTAPTTGTYSFTASNVHSPNTSILVTGLSR